MALETPEPQTEAAAPAQQHATSTQQHHAGSAGMPPWNVGELDDAPHLSWRHWTQMLGPGLLMAGAAIGGGEWLMGPKVTAKYGGAVMWLATLSLMAQVVYNVEASRYTLYSGEPIMLGKFRTLPGPIFWLFIYLALDFGSLFPYLAANAATPVLALWLGKLPTPETVPEHKTALQWITYGVLMLSLLPLIFGGKIYNALRWVMGVKIVVVLGFLAFIAFWYSSAETWASIFGGLFQFGTVPVKGGGTENVFGSLLRGEGFPEFATEAIPPLAAFAAIAGVGGMAQSSVSNYTRDQGWGMGRHVGAIPSLVGGQNIELSHVGTVFTPTEETQRRWKRWYWHVLRDQLIIWMPACIIGVALPAMLSVEFLPRNIEPSDWTVAGMTADGVQARVGGGLGQFYWYMILFCGFLVLVPSTSSSADGFVRRWVDVSWTSLKSLRSMDPKKIRHFYFGFLSVYFISGLFLLSVAKPVGLLFIATTLNNFALGFSCFHTLYVNCSLLPRELRPSWITRILLSCSGIFFITLATITFMVAMKWIK
ncbi:MAG TPA: Nramp family divalent metal transporter [Planctomycetota bacterium]|nr:Nramp family divalent metal transporter [Planctomycetota bacterium]